MTFAQLFDPLLIPRENGSPALAHVAAWLQQVAHAAGATVRVDEFACRPYALRLAGAVALVLAVGFVAAVWRQRFGLAVALAIAIPAYLLLEVEYGIGLLGWLFAVKEHNLIFSFPVAAATRTVILGAHYDTKTDLLDHYQRAPIQFLIVPVAALSFATAISGWRRLRQGLNLRPVRVLALLAGVYYGAFFLTLTGGAFVPRRSPGALDDGAAVAVLLRVAEALGSKALALEHTNVDIVLFAGEEVGMQGSRAYVASHRDSLSPSNTYFINAEGLGLGPNLRYFTSDRSPLRRYDAAAALARWLDDAHRQVAHRGLIPDSLPVMTDARSFMAAGIPAITLGSYGGHTRIIRGLHSARDSRSRIDLPALERTLRFYTAALGTIDRS